MSAKRCFILAILVSVGCALAANALTPLMSAQSALTVLPFTPATAGGGTAQWTTADKHTGSSSVRLVTSSDGDYAGVGYAGYTGLVDNINSMSVWYHCTAWDTWSGPRVSLLIDTDHDGQVDHAAVSADIPGGTTASWTQWLPDFGSNTGSNRFWYSAYDPVTGYDHGNQVGPVSFDDVKSHFSGADVLTEAVYLGVVTATVVGAGDCYVDDPEVNGVTFYGQIRDAVDAASAGDTVDVAAGTYVETGQIVISKDLSIVGAGASQTVIKPAGDTGSSGDARGWFLVNSGITFNLSDVTLDGTGRNVYQAIRHKGSGTISDCAFSNIKYPGYSGMGMAVMGPSGTNVDVTSCTFTEMGRIGVIYFGAGVTGTFSGNTYTGKGDGDWLDYAVEVGGGANATITNNTISGNTGVASVDGSTSAGILATTYYGAGTQATITGNTISGCTEGIAVGYDASDTSVVTAHNNNLAGNDTGIGSTAPAVDAEDNWWGSASGPTHASNTFNVGSQGVPVSDNVDFVPWLDAALPGGVSFAPVTTTDPVGSHASIQAGVDFSNAGGTVNAVGGTYVEQVEIAKDLTLRGAGPSTIIQSPDTLTKKFTTSADNYPIVYIHDASNVNVEDLMVDGAGKGNANYRFVGIAFRNAGGAVRNSEIKDVRDTPFSGAQHGVALYAYNDDGTGRTVEVTDNVITGFQKNAMALNAAATTPLAVDVSGNEVAGYGATTVTAQNGIQVWADLGSGTVADNTVSGIAYDNTSSPTKWVATSILNYYADLDITGNTIDDGHLGVYNIDGSGRINDNDITIEKVGVYAFGIIATDPPDIVPSPFDVVEPRTQGSEGLPGLAEPLAMSVLSVEVSGNEVTFSGGDNTSTYGIEADAGYGPDDLAFTANDNVVTGFEVGIELYACESECDTGVFTSIEAHQNDLDGNTIGMRSNVTYLTADAEDNWWGSADGPTHGSNTFNVASQGVPVSDNVDFVPWLDAVPPAGASFAPVTTTDPVGSHASIQAGVNYSNPGGTVNAKAGIFSENVAVNKALTVQAASAPVIDCGGAGGDGVTLSANNVTIDGFEIRNCDNGISGQTSNSTIRDNVIHDNTNAPGYAGVGILLWGDNDDNQIVDNTVHNNDRQGVFIGHDTLISTGNLVSGNTIYDNGRNTIPNPPDASAYGIQLWNADSNTIDDNEVYGHDNWEPYPGFDFAQGIYLFDSNDNLVSGNDLHDNNYGVGLWGPGRGDGSNHINLNNLAGNTGYGVRNFDAPTIDAEDNWWGSANGPTHASNTFNVGSQGVAVSGNVHFAPWLDAPPPTGVSFAPVTTTDPVGDHASIQAGINFSNPGGTVNAKAGTFTENVMVNKSVTVAGAGQGATLVIPAVSLPNPCAGSSLCGSGSAASNIFLVEASDVTIHDLTADGDNPTLTSGIVRGGADLDARNGIIENYYAGVFNNLNVHDVTVRNIYLRGIYPASGGSGFVVDDNTVQNVQGEYASICIFNFGGSGIISDNTVSDCNDGIAANWSKGTQFTGNTVTNSGSGVHSDNNGGMGGVGDLIQGNTVTNSTAGGYGVWTFVPYVPITVQNNTVSSVDVGLAASGQAVSAPGSTSFVNNQVTGIPGSTGVYVTTDQFGWGSGNVSATFTGNTITGHADGFVIEAQAGYTATVNASGNSIYGNSVSGATLTGAGTLTATMEDNWWGSASGPSHPSNTFNVPTQGNAVVGTADFVPWLDAAPPTGVSFAPVTTTSPVESYASIQAGVDGSNPGGTVDAKVGTFDEQVVIGKSVTLQGGGAGTVVKPSSAAKLATVLSGHWWGLTRQIAGIVVANVADGSAVTVKNLKVDGEDVVTQPPGAEFVAGAFYRETGGAIDSVTATNMTVGATGTAVRGYGAYLSAVANTVSIEVKGSTFTNYDKNGIDAHGNTLSVNAHDNALTGRGPLPSGDEVQNGVVVMDGATGAVNGNNVSSHVYTPETWWAAAVLFMDSSGSAWNNTLTDNQIGVIFQDGNGSASGNTVSGGKLGLYAQSTKAGTWTGSFTSNTVGGSDTAGIGGATYHAGASMAVAIGNNTLTGGPGAGVAIGDAPEYDPAGSVSATVTGNVVTGWSIGVDILSSGAGTSTINFNTILGNTQFGVRNMETVTVNAENNWWGCSGPYHPLLNPLGTGDSVSDYVDFDPWITGPCDTDGDGLTNDQERLIYFTDPYDPDTDHDGFFDGPVDVDGPGPGQPNDNCRTVSNPGQENADNQIGNGIGIPGHDGTVPSSAGDAVGDACDAPDADNDGIPNVSDPDPGGDITYDDNGNGSMCPTDAADDGPSWDSNCNGKIDGSESVCPLAVNPNGDDDGDGLRNTWEVCKWGSSATVIDSDADTLGDCTEAADVDGNGAVTFTGDAIAYARAAQLPPAAFGRDGDFDIDGNGTINFTGDAIQEAKFAQIAQLCK